MSLGIDIRVDGDREIERMLRGWKPSAQRRAVRPGVSKAARHVGRVAKGEAPVESGLLRKSIGVRVRTYRNGTVVGVVGPRKGFRREVARSGGRWTSTAGGVARAKATLIARIQVRDPVKYSHLVHDGTKPHQLGRGSSTRRASVSHGKRHPGTRPNPFLKRAAVSSRSTVSAIMRQEVRKGVGREARRLLRKGGLAV